MPNMMDAYSKGIKLAPNVTESCRFNPITVFNTGMAGYSVTLRIEFTGR
jgi:hypothetical protein